MTFSQTQKPYEGPIMQDPFNIKLWPCELWAEDESPYWTFTKCMVTGVQGMFSGADPQSIDAWITQHEEAHEKHETGRKRKEPNWRTPRYSSPESYMPEEISQDIGVSKPSITRRPHQHRQRTQFPKL